MILKASPNLSPISQEFQQTLMNAFPKKISLEMALSHTLGVNGLEKYCSIENKSLREIVYSFVQELDTKEDFDRFIFRSLLVLETVEEKKKISNFVDNNINFILEYAFPTCNAKELQNYRQSLEKVDDINLLLDSFKSISIKYNFDWYRENLKSNIDFNHDSWKNDGLSNLSRIFLFLYLLLSENEYEIYIQELIDFGNKKNDLSNPILSNNKERACLQILMDDGRLKDEIVFRNAFLRFDFVNQDPSDSNQKRINKTIDIIEIYSIKNKGDLSGLTVKFSPTQGGKPILDFLQYSEDQIVQRRRLGYSVEPRLWIEIFLPRKRLFERIDAWPRPVSKKRSGPLSQKYKIVYCSLERLKDPGLLLNLLDTCQQVKFSNSSWIAITKIDGNIESIFNDLDEKIGVLCPLERLDILRGEFIDILWEKGLPYIIGIDFNKNSNKLEKIN